MALALLAHAFVFVALSGLFAAARPHRPGFGSVAVTLVGSMGAAGKIAGSEAAATDPLAALQSSLAEPEPRSERVERRPSTPLSELVGEAALRTAGTGGKPSPGAAGGAPVGEGADPYAYASLSAGDAQKASGRSLRDQALRCARGEPSPSGVRLRVTLDAQGRLSGAPQVLPSRDGSRAPREPAIANTLAAVRDCAPYVAAGGTYDLEFR